MQVVHVLSSMVSFYELLRLRLVCKYWNEIVIGLPKYWEKMNVQLDQRWIKNDVKKCSVDSSCRWKHLTYKDHAFKRTLFMIRHWPMVKRSLTTLVFKNLTKDCNRFVQMMNQIVNLTSVSFINIHYLIPPGEKIKEFQSFCTHNHDDLKRYEVLRDSLQAGRISRIVCQNCSIIPNCAILLLAHRSKGTLCRLPVNQLLPYASFVTFSNQNRNFT